MPLEPHDNPFTMVYQALYELALLHPKLSADVSPGNRIRYDDPFNRSPVKKNVAVADTPELILVPDTLSCNIHNSSSSSKVVRQYKWMVATGDFRYTSILAQVEWSLFCAMCNWQRVLTSLCWREQSFVKRLDVPTGSAGVSDLNLNRGLAGWSAIWRCEVEMHFKTSDLYGEVINGSA